MKPQTLFTTVLTIVLLCIIAAQAVHTAHLQDAQGKVFSPRMSSPHHLVFCISIDFVSDGLSITRDLERRGSVPTRFMSENETDAAQAWDAIESGYGFVAVDAQWAAARDLPQSTIHPLDSSKVVYIIDAYHEMHCLKNIRKHYMALAVGTVPQRPMEHDMHCFDALRQHIMCMADDTLLYTAGHHDSGVNQTRMCSDWDALDR